MPRISINQLTPLEGGHRFHLCDERTLFQFPLDVLLARLDEEEARMEDTAPPPVSQVMNPPSEHHEFRDMADQLRAICDAPLENILLALIRTMHPSSGHSTYALFAIRRGDKHYRAEIIGRASFIKGLFADLMSEDAAIAMESAMETQMREIDLEMERLRRMRESRHCVSLGLSDLLTLKRLGPEGRAELSRATTHYYQELHAPHHTPHTSPKPAGAA